MVPRHEWLDRRLRLALLKENAAYRTLWDKHGAAALAEIGDLAAQDPSSPAFVGNADPDIKCVVDSLHVFYTGLNECGILDARSLAVTFADWLKTLNVLNPYTDENPEPCPIFFDDPLPVCGVIHNGGIQEHWHRTTPDEAVKEPSVRLLAIDLSRKKSEILDEVSQYIDNVARNRTFLEQGHYFPGESENYSQWKTDTARRRDETWKHLQVWQLRRQRKSYLQISREIGIRVDAAKKAFARAFELIEGRQYSPDHFKQAYKDIPAHELKRTCATCPDNPARGGSCSEPCPDVLAFIEQDQVGLSEQLTPARK